MKKSKLLLVLFILSFQGMIACRSDDISPQLSSSKIQDFIQNNRLARVTVDSLNTDSLVRITDLDNANSFLKSLKNKAKPSSFYFKNDTWQSPKATESMVAQGIFTFLNGQKAIILFDEKGEINSLNLDGDGGVSYEYDKTSGYLEIIKWGIVSNLHEEGNQLNESGFFRTPIIRWYAYLNNGWSGVQFLNQPEQANTEGFGHFELTYIPTAKPVIDPVVPIRKTLSD
jgi:hypothetical protein